MWGKGEGGEGEEGCGEGGEGEERWGEGDENRGSMKGGRDARDEGEGVGGGDVGEGVEGRGGDVRRSMGAPFRLCASNPTSLCKRLSCFALLLPFGSGNSVAELLHSNCVSVMEYST